MHQSSYLIMKRIVSSQLSVKDNLNILDVGSMDVNGTYRDIFTPVANWKYSGLDIAPGNNVDIVSKDNYHWPILDNTYDVVISGQCMEHVPLFWGWIKEVARVTKLGGLIVIIAPWLAGQHRYPVDCWRILPDGMEFLLGTVASLNVLYVGNNQSIGIPSHANYEDCFGVARKPNI